MIHGRRANGELYEESQDYDAHGRVGHGQNLVTGKDFDERHTAMAREAGFSAAFTTSVGAVTSALDRFQLPRSRPWDRSPLMFGLRLLRWLAQGRPQ